MVYSLCPQAYVQAVLDANKRPGYTKSFVMIHEDTDDSLVNLELGLTMVTVEGWVMLKADTVAA